jgi:ATP-dependent DNA helicase RecG
VKPTITQTENAFRITLPNVNFAHPVRSAITPHEHSSPEQLILALAHVKKAITRKDVQELLGVSQSYAGRLLREMVAHHHLKATGAGKATMYEVV